MKSLSLAIVPKLGALFHKFFPKTRQDELWRQVQPHAYDYALRPGGLILGLMMAYLARASGLRQLAERHGELLGTHNFSSLSHAFSRPVTALFVAALRAALEGLWTPAPLALVAIDGMALTLKKGYRHRCRRYNDSVVGGGVIWAYLIGAAAGVCPVKVLSLLQGAWSDVTQLRSLPPLAVGPLYLLDRGFYAIDLIQQWLKAGVHFIVRANARNFSYQPVCTRGPARRVGRVGVQWDGLALLGGPSVKAPPLVRLVVGRLDSGEPLILVSEQWLGSAEAILAAYKRRWQIERFHKLLKSVLGLAHLYNFSQSGLEVQLQTVLLLAELIYLGELVQAGGEDVIEVLRRGLRAMLAQVGLGTPWRRNSCTQTQARNKRKRKAKKQQTTKTVKR